MRVVIDTNWLISYLIKGSGDLKLILLDGNISIATTEKQIREFLNKIYSLKFRKYFEVEKALDFIQNFAKRAQFVNIETELTN